MIRNKEEFNDVQILNRYKYGLHCYVITLVIIFLGICIREFSSITFENDIDFLLLILCVCTAYYISRTVWIGAFLPRQWINKSRHIILIMLIVNTMVAVRWWTVSHNVADILTDQVIYSDFIENFMMQFLAIIMLFSFAISCVCKKKEE